MDRHLSVVVAVSMLAAALASSARADELLGSCSWTCTQDVITGSPEASVSAQRKAAVQAMGALPTNGDLKKGVQTVVGKYASAKEANADHIETLKDGKFAFQLAGGFIAAGGPETAIPAAVVGS